MDLDCSRQLGDSHIVIKILYVMIIILSFIAGIRGIFQQYFSKS